MESLLTDVDCLARSLREPNAFEPIFERHFRAVHTYLHRRAGRDLADELAADTFALAFERRASCRATESALPWLYGIATNLLRRRRRAESRQLRAYGRSGVDPSVVYEDEAAARVDSTSAGARLAGALAAMRPRERDALLLYALLNLFRDFRRGVAGPSDDATQQAFTRLTAAIEGAHERRTRVPRLVRQRRGRTVLAFAALAGATAVALFASTPWKSSPGFLERAQAALVHPAGTVLHVKREWTRSLADSSCISTDPPSEMWVDQAPPYRFRILGNASDPNPCVVGPPVEIGGTVATQEVLEFVPPDRLRPAMFFRFGTQPDPVAGLRQAISDGRAHHDGTTELDGRTLERIRIDGPSDCPVAQFPGCDRDPSYIYVDPETYYPVRGEDPHGYAIPRPGGPLVRFHTVMRWLTFEYLPGTDANRALADIRAQHPGATGP